MSTPATVRLTFDWSMLEGGQFKPITITPNPPIQVVVEVPLEPEYFADYAERLTAQLYEGKVITPKLTPRGMHYVLDVIQYELASSLEPEVSETDSNMDDDLEFID